MSDSLLRLLGADPLTFRPLYRVQKLLLKRTVRSMQARKSTFNFSPFSLLCVFAFVYGVLGSSTLAGSKSHLLGGLFSLILGCAFLLLVVIADNFDVLIDSREMLVLGALPQDGRSLLLAKLAALGRHLSILAVLLFALPGLTAGFVFQSPLAAAAFWAGAAAASVSTVTCGLLFAAAVLRLSGRKALDRMLPWIQTLLRIGYFLALAGQRMSRLLTAASPATLGALSWTPPFWFLSPLELATAGPSGPVLARLALAVATPALLLGGATRWLGSGLREQLLEPRQQTASRQAGRRRPAIRSGGGERSRLFALLRVQLRADWRVRSEFLLVPVMGTFMIFFYQHDFQIVRSIPMMAVYFYSWIVLIASDALTRSSRPENLWWILVAPIDRGRFSLGTLPLVRLFQLMPLFAAVTVAVIRAGGTWPLRLALLAELLALGDLLIVAGKGIFAEFPFSRLRSDGGASGGRASLALVGALVGGATTAIVFACGFFGVAGALAGAAFFSLLHVPAGLWARRRATAAAEGLEMAASVE